MDARMIRASAVLAVVVGLGGVASAGPYAGFALGPSPTIGNGVPDYAGSAGVLEFAPGGRAGRVLGGYRFPTLPVIGSFSIEAALTGYALTDQFGTSTFGGRQAMLSGKYNYPLSAGFEVFGRLGLGHTWITPHSTSDISRSGDGLVIGAGFEYRFKLPMAQASLWTDYTYNTASLEDVSYTRDYSSRQWMLGFTFGM